MFNEKVCVILNFWRLFIPAYLYITAGESNRVNIGADLERLYFMLPSHRVSLFNIFYALIFNKTFRAVYYYRFSRHKIACMISNWLLPNRREIELSGEIGKGMVIYHGQCCVIHCASAGEHLSVWQGVTVGRNPSVTIDGRDKPIIGENVNLYTGCIVAGGIIIGNNVDIAAGAVVMKSVPDNCVVAGNPAHIVKLDGKRVDIKL